jgi:hypothetical protein
MKGAWLMRLQLRLRRTKISRVCLIAFWGQNVSDLLQCTAHVLGARRWVYPTRGAR